MRITKYLPHVCTYQLPMSAECCDMFPRCKIFIPLVHTGTSTIISATKASLDLCHSMPSGVPHPIRFTSVPWPLRHLILVDFAGNLVHLRSFVSESIFEPVVVRCFDWVVGHRYSAFGHKTEMLESVSQNIFCNFGEHPNQKPPAPITRTT